MRATDFRNAVSAARTGNYETHRLNFSETIFTPPGLGCPNGYYNNSVQLNCEGANGEIFTVQLTEKGWFLCEDERPFCRISDDIAQKLEEEREDALNYEHHEERRYREFVYEREELWRNYGPARN